MTEARRIDEATVVPYRDGPLIIRGAFRVLDQEGEPIGTPRATVALWRCGRSRARPFCDGSHRLTGFRASDRAEGPDSRECREDDGNSCR